MLGEGENGHPLAVMDSIEVTILRTAAAAAIGYERAVSAGGGRVIHLGQ